jgi:hypothetical protein
MQGELNASIERCDRGSDSLDLILGMQTISLPQS